MLFPFPAHFQTCVGRRGLQTQRRGGQEGRPRAPSKGGSGARRDLCGLPALGLSPPFSLVTALLVSSVTLPLSLLPTHSPFKIN